MLENNIIKVLMFIQMYNYTIDEVSNILNISTKDINKVLKQYENIELTDDKNILVSY